MTNSEKHIVQLFQELDDNQKLNCLKFLQFNADPAEVIKRFGQRHQKVHKSSISFDSFPSLVTEGIILTTVKMNTAFGKFTGIGKTANEAKFFAVRNAENVEYSMLTDAEDKIGLLLDIQDKKWF